MNNLKFHKFTNFSLLRKYRRLMNNNNNKKIKHQIAASVRIIIITIIMDTHNNKTIFTNSL